MRPRLGIARVKMDTGNATQYQVSVLISFQFAKQFTFNLDLDLDVPPRRVACARLMRSKNPAGPIWKAIR
jgi:hypothetical protein